MEKNYKDDKLYRNEYELNKVYYGDTMELMKSIPDNFVDLGVTSPPYATTKSYGKNVPLFHPDNYVDWLLPLFKEMPRFLKPSGSFILNMNDKIIGGYRHTFVYELIYRISKETDLKLHDRYIWHKKSALPTGGDRRLNDMIEYIFHFVRSKDFKCDIDRIRVPYTESSIKRFKSKVACNSTINENGISTYDHYKKLEPNPKGKKPGNVMRFNTAAVLRSKVEKHPAPFHHDLPEYFINYLSDENDVVFDPFIGGGTVAQVCKKLDRQWFGFEINQEYDKMVDWKLENLY